MGVEKMKEKVLKKGLLLLGCILSICGCGNKESISKSVDYEETQKEECKIINGYEEIKYTMPEELTWIFPIGVGWTNEEKLVVVGNAGDKCKVWFSADYGKSWEEPIELPEEFQPVEENRAIISATVSAEGEIAIIRSHAYDENNDERDYWTWMPGKSPRQLLIELEKDEFYSKHERTRESKDINPNAFVEWKYTVDGKILAKAMNNQVFLIDDENGKILSKTAYSEDVERIEYMQVLDGKIVVQTASGGLCYSAETGEFLETDTEIMKDVESLAGMAEITNVGNRYELFEKNGEFYELGKSGIYQGKGEEKKQIISGKEAAIGNQRVLYMGCVSIRDRDFVIPCLENGKYFILEYRYKGEEKNKNEESGILKIYALKKNDNLSQAIELYKNQFTGVNVELEIGMSEEGNVTISDAIRKLSTKIMAGDGPDVIMLDGIPVEQYVEKGILEDVTDIYQKVDKKEGLLKNVAGAYPKKEKIYAIPTHFYMPICMGKENDVNKIKDLESLCKILESLAETEEKVVVDMDAQGMLEYLTAISSDAWVKNGKLEKEILKEFLINYGEICKVLNLEAIDFKEENYLEDLRNDYLQPIFFANGENKISFGVIKSFGDISQISSAMRQTEGSTWRVQDGQAKQIFLQSAIIGINSRGENKEEARRFVEYILSSESQMNGAGSGFPVNEHAIKELIRAEKEAKTWIITRAGVGTGKELELTVFPASEEELDKFYQSMKEVKTPELSDQIIKQTVEEFAVLYVKGEISLGEAMENIESRVELYLAE